MLDEKLYWALIAEIPNCSSIPSSVEEHLIDGIFYGYRLKPDIDPLEAWFMMTPGSFVYGYFTSHKRAQKLLQLMQLNPFVVNGHVKVYIEPFSSHVLSFYKKPILLDYFYLMGCAEYDLYLKPLPIETAIRMFTAKYKSRSMSSLRLQSQSLSSQFRSFSSQIDPSRNPFL
jgi:hypothetical protein